MSGNRVGELLASAFGTVFILFIGWGETVGVVHAFRQHGSGSGWAALFIPPVAWWRGVEFFTHARPPHEAPSATDAPSSVAIPLDAAETSVMSEVMSHAMAGTLHEEDLQRYKDTCRRYLRRGGTSLTVEGAAFFLRATALVVTYNKELGRCLLVSFDTRQPFESVDLQKLRSQMAKTGQVRAGKLEADKHKLTSTAQRTPWTDEFGQTFAPLDRDEIVAGLAMADTVEGNMKRLFLALEEVSGER